MSAAAAQVIKGQNSASLTAVRSQIAVVFKVFTLFGNKCKLVSFSSTRQNNVSCVRYIGLNKTSLKDPSMNTHIATDLGSHGSGTKNWSMKTKRKKCRDKFGATGMA